MASSEGPLWKMCTISLDNRKKSTVAITLTHPLLRISLVIITFFFFFFPLGDLELLNSSIVSFVPLKENVTRKVQKLGVAFKENDRR